MRKIFAITTLLVLFAFGIAQAQLGVPGLIKVREADGDPSGWVYEIVVTNDGLSLSGNTGTISLTAGAGQPVTLTIGGEAKSADLAGVIITNDTNSIFTEAPADNLAIDVSKRWPTADVANAGDSATAFFSAGTIEAARLPVPSATTGGIAPTTVAASTGDVLTVQSDGSVAWEVSSSGVTTIAAATDTNIATPAEANILIYDGSDSWDNKAVSGDVTMAATGAVTIGANKILESMLKAVDSATDEDVLTYDSDGGGDFEWHSRNEIASGATVVTYADGALVDFSGITHTGSADEGLALPAWADVTPTSNKKFLAADGSSLKLYNGGWVTIGATAAPTDAKYIVQAGDATLSAEQVLTEGTGIDLTLNTTPDPDTLTVAVDSTEIGTTTWGSGSAITWTFDASAGTDATIAAGDGGFAITGTLSATGAIAANGGITMGTGDGFTVNSVNLLSGDELDGTKIKDADYGDVTISEAGAWAVEDDSHAHGSTTITLASTNLSDTSNVARLDADNTFTGTTNTVGNANTDILAVQATMRGVGRAVSIDDDTTTAPTYATGTNELFVEGDVEVGGTLYASTINTGTGTDGERAITMTTNTTFTPAGNQIYYTNDTFLFSQAGAEKTPMRLEDAQTVSGIKTFQNGLYIGDASTTTVFRLYDGSSNYWSVAVPAMSGNYTLTLPADDGTANQVLTTDGSGATTWASPTATAAGASAGMVQYNATGSGGALNASAHFIYTEPSAALLTIGSEGTGKTGNLALAYEGGTNDYTATIGPNSAMAADIAITLPSYATTLLGSGANTFTGTQTYSANEAAITHSGTTSLTIASTSGTVIVEGVTFTGAALTGISDITTTGDTIIGDDLSLTSDGAVINIGAGNDVTITHSANTLTLGGGNLALGANNLTMTGDLAATGARVNKVWTAALESTAIPSVNGVAGNATNGIVTNPMTGAGDMIIGGASGATTRLAAGATTEVLVGGGAAAPVWTTATGTGAPARAGSPTFTTKITTPLIDLGTGISATGGAGVVTFTDLGGTSEVLAIDLRTENTAKLTTTSGVSDLNIGALNLVTTGQISGRIPVVADADGKTLSGTDLYGSMQMATGAGTWVIPDVDAAAGTGQAFCVYTTGAHEIVIDGNAEDKIRLAGTLGAAGGNITNATAEAAGDFICLMLTDFDGDIAHWTTLGSKGTWTVP